MLRCRITADSLIAVAMLLTAVSASAQDSFLEEFRSINTADRANHRTVRPAFLTPLSHESDRELERSDDSRESLPPNAITQPEWDSTRHLASIEELCAEKSDAAACVPKDINDSPLVRFRSGCYQGSQASFAWVGDTSDNGLAIRTLDTSTMFAVPLGSMDHLITFSPFFRADMLDAAASLDVPDTLYETGVRTFWRRPINDRLGSMVVFTPSVRSDFQTSDGAFRLFGMGLLTWQWIPQKLALSGGVVYTGREDYPILPAMGLLWTPTPRWRLDMQFPSPRLSYRIGKDGANNESWVYLAGVFGGNTWAVTRSSGQADMLTLRDLRLVSGIEHLLTKNRGVFVETGLVFNRSLEYTVVPLERDLDTTYMLRAGISF